MVPNEFKRVMLDPHGTYIIVELFANNYFSDCTNVLLCLAMCLSAAISKIHSISKRKETKM